MIDMMYLHCDTIELSVLQPDVFDTIIYFIAAKIKVYIKSLLKRYKHLGLLFLWLTVCLFVRNCTKNPPIFSRDFKWQHDTKFVLNAFTSHQLHLYQFLSLYLLYTTRKIYMFNQGNIAQLYLSYILLHNQQKTNQILHIDLFKGFFQIDLT